MAVDSISFKKLASFAPPALATALKAEQKPGFTVAEVTALADRFRDQQDFESAGYLNAMLGMLTADAPSAPAVAPTDPITAEAEAVKAKQAALAKLAAEIAAHTGMPAAHAELYAEAGYTAAQSAEGWKVGLQGGAAFMYAHLGLKPEEAVSLAAAKVDPAAAYDLIDQQVPIAMIPQAVASDVDSYHLRRFAEAGFNAAETAELISLGFDTDHIPHFMTLEQVKVALEKGVPLDRSYTLLKDQLFDFDEMLELYAANPDLEAFTIADVQKLCILPFEEIVELARSRTPKTNRKVVPVLVQAGFSAAQIAECADFKFSLNIIRDALGSGYSQDELLAMWKKNIGLKAEPSSQSLPPCHQAGFDLAQLEQLKKTPVKSYEIEHYAELGFKADEILNLAARGYASYYKFKEENLDLGLSAREAYDALMSS